MSAFELLRVKRASRLDSPSRRVWAWSLMGLVVAATTPLSACGEAPVSNATGACEKACVAGDCAKPIMCASSADCPKGTGCDGTVCGVMPYATTPNTALINGFSVREFDLTRQTGDTGVMYAFRAPHAASFAECGLFACGPEFSGAGSDQGEGRVMLNATRCLVRNRVFRVETADRDSSFAITDLDEVERGSCAGKSGLNAFSDERDYPVVTVLQVGCWAYGDVGVVAATPPLTSLGLAEFPEFGDVPVDCTTETVPTDGSICTRDPPQGACRGGQCVVGDTPANGGAGGSSGGGVGSVAVGGSDDAADALLVLTQCAASTEGRACVDTQVVRLGRCSLEQVVC